MTQPTPGVPSTAATPRPVPGPPGVASGGAVDDAVRDLESVPSEDLDGILAAAERAHERLRERLGHAGGR